MLMLTETHSGRRSAIIRQHALSGPNFKFLSHFSWDPLAAMFPRWI